MAGSAPVDPVAGTVFFQAFFLEHIGGLTKMRGNATNIFLGKCWRHRFAAVGATKAIRFNPHFFFQVLNFGLKTNGWIFFNT